MKLSEVMFLGVDDVERMHARGLELYGGSAGVRDRGLLESAVMAPQATYGSAPLNPTLATMAAALAPGIAKNHPFVDGNKRAAATASLTMLALNGFNLKLPQAEWTDLFMRLAGDPSLRRDELVERFAEAMGGDVDVESDD